MSPNNSNSPKNSKSDDSNITVSDNDLRCGFCGHNRSKCSICQTQRSHSSAADRRKAYCCKCKHKSKLTRFFDPYHKEMLALVNCTELKIDAAARLRSYIFQSLKSEQCHKFLTTCGGFSRMDAGYDHGSSGSHMFSPVIFDCQMPGQSYHSDVAAFSILKHRALQVENIVLRLILLISNGDPIDTGILRTVLQTLLNQLATLTHRAFSALMPGVFPNRKAFQHCLRIASRGVQALYKELWVAALRTGLLRRSCGHAGLAGKPIEPDTLTMEPGERQIVPSHDAGIRHLLWKSRTLSDELRFWLALLRVGRTL